MDGTLVLHTAATLTEVLLGLLVGTTAAVILGYAIAKSRLFEQLVSPYLVATQAIPVVAIAPLLVIWFGPGIFSKVLICALIVFFPVLVNTVVGVRAVPRPFHDLMQSLHATRRPNPAHARAACLASGLTGRVADRGYAFGHRGGGGRTGRFGPRSRFPGQRGRGQYDTALVFVAVFTLIALALALYGLVSFLERKFLSWREPFQR